MRSFAIFLTLAASVSAQSDLARDLVQPHVDKITDCRAAVQEIDRRSAQRLAELAEWREFYASTATQAVDAFIGLWKEHNKERLDQLNKQYATATRRGRQIKDWAGVPHFNGRMFHLKDAIDKAEKAITDLETGLRKKAVWMRIAFIGKITDIAVKIDEIDTESAQIRAQVAKGEYRIHYPGLGDVWKNRLQGMIDHEEKAKRHILDLIKEGEYKVNVPGVGWHTRKSLTAEIVAVSKEIESARATLKKGEWNIHRPLFSWLKQKDLEKAIEGKAEIVARQQKWRNDPLFKLFFPGAFNWFTAIDVEKKITEVKKGIDDVRQSVSQGAYKVYVEMYGQKDANEVRKALADVQRELSKSDLTRKAREELNARVKALQQGLNDIKTLSALDLTIRMLDKTWWTKALGAIVSLAKPELEGRKLDLRQYSAHMAEYERELDIVVQRHERRLQHLKRGFAYIP